MAVVLKLTRLRHLNDTIVIKQEGGHYFIAAENSIIIDKEGLIRLIVELSKVGYLNPLDLAKIGNAMFPWEEEDKENA